MRTGKSVRLFFGLLFGASSAGCTFLDPLNDLGSGIGTARGYEFVQLNFSIPQDPLAEAQTTFTQTQTAGNMNMVVLGWSNGGQSITSISDSNGNAYAVAANMAQSTHVSQVMYYARSIAGGADRVTVQFDRPVTSLDMRIVEYSGGSSARSVIDSAVGQGLTDLASAGPVITTAPGELVFAAGTTLTGFSSAEAFTERVITPMDADIVEDLSAEGSGPVTATASLSRAGEWILQVIVVQ